MLPCCRCPMAGLPLATRFPGGGWWLWLPAAASTLPHPTRGGSDRISLPFVCGEGDRATKGSQLTAGEVSWCVCHVSLFSVNILNEISLFLSWCVTIVTMKLGYKNRQCIVQSEDALWVQDTL